MSLQDKEELQRSSESLPRLGPKVQSAAGGELAEREPESLRARWCRGCTGLFLVCRSCDRGQRYCSEVCRGPARHAQQSAARRRHQQSPEGSADHRDHQRAFRERQRAFRERQRAVMDHPSEEEVEMEILTVVGLAVSNEPGEKETNGELLFLWNPEDPCCRFCGRESVYLDCG